MSNCVYFCLHLLYNYYGDNMKNKSPLIMSISTMEDIKTLESTPSVKYLNVDITNPNLEVVYYLLDNGENYSYADLLDGKNGYIYVSYEVFKEGQLELLDIINTIPTNLNKLEIARYLYIKLGKTIGYDINVLPDKNETFNLQTINTINNIWGSIKNKKGTNISFVKIYLYLCRILNIDCDIISVNNGYLKNVLTIDNKSILTDITGDIPLIQAGFKTNGFLGYNDNQELDKKVNYIKDDYNENIIEHELKNIDYNSTNLVETILTKTQKIINIDNIKPIELGIIYAIIFEKYCPNQDITINNLFINGIYNNKEHFILISTGDKHYSYNYTKSSFIEISSEEIIKNIESKKIGVYLNEKIPNLNKEKVMQ